MNGLDLGTPGGSLVVSALALAVSIAALFNSNRWARKNAYRDSALRVNVHLQQLNRPTALDSQEDMIKTLAALDALKAEAVTPGSCLLIDGSTKPLNDLARVSERIHAILRQPQDTLSRADKVDVTKSILRTTTNVLVYLYASSGNTAYRKIVSKFRSKRDAREFYARIKATIDSVGK